MTLMIETPSREVIVDGGRYSLPLPRDAAFRINFLDADNNAVVPDKITSVAAYRTERGSSIEDSNLFHVLGFASTSDGALWESNQQSVATGSIASRKAAFNLSEGLLNGLAHDFGQDHLIVDGIELVLDPARVTLTSAVSGYDLIIDLTNVAQDGAVIEFVYATAPFGGIVDMISTGVFDFNFDTATCRFWPGTHHVIIEFEKDGEPHAYSIEFRADREGMTTSPSSRFSDDFLQRVLLRQIPRMFPDQEDGLGGPSGEKFRYVQKAVEEMRVMVDSISDAWGIDTAPASLLEYIASEYGTFLAGTDQVSWRQQVSDLILRWKSRGSTKAIRERLADCGVSLEKFTKFFQARPRKFHVFSSIITRNTRWEPLSRDLPGRIWILPMSKAPWVFPSADSDRTEFVPSFAVLEARSEGSKDWVRVPSSRDGHVIMRFRSEADRWYVTISPEKIVEAEDGARKLALVDERLRIDEFTEVRVTYAVSPWGVIPFERTLSLAQIDPAKRRSGPVSVSSDGTDYLTIGLQDGIASTQLFNRSTGAEIAVTGEAPSPRMGFSVIRYAGSKLLLFGGVEENGKILGDTWLLDFSDFSDLTWTRYNESFDAPSPRAGSTVLMAQNEDASEYRFILHGGMGTASVLGDTWEWNGIDERWVHYQQPRFVRRIGTISFSDNPIDGQSVTATINLGDDINANDTLFLTNIADPSSGYLQVTVDSIAPGVIEFTVDESDGYDWETASAVTAWSVRQTLADFAVAYQTSTIAFDPGVVDGQDITFSTDPDVTNALALLDGQTVDFVDASNPARGYIRGTVIDADTNTNISEIQFVGASGDFVMGENAALVDNWALMTYYVEPTPFNEAFIRSGNTVDLLAVLVAESKCSARVIFRDSSGLVIRLNNLPTATSATPWHVIPSNLEPPSRCGAAGHSAIFDQSTDLTGLGWMHGGWSSSDTCLGDLWAFEFETGWLQVWPDGPGPVGFCGSIIAATDSAIEIYVGGGVTDHFPAGDPLKIVDHPTRWFHLTHSGSSAESLNSVGAAQWVESSSVYNQGPALPTQSTMANIFTDQAYVFNYDREVGEAPRRLRSSYEVALAGGHEFTLTEGSSVFPLSELDVLRPVAIGTVSSPDEEPEAPYSTTVDDDIIGVYANASAYDTLKFTVAEPTKFFASVTGENYWNIMPDREVVTIGQMATPIGSADGSLSSPLNLAIFPPASRDFTVTSDMVSFCPLVVEGSHAKLLARIFSRDGVLLGHMAVDSGENVTTDVTTFTTARFAGKILLITTDVALHPEHLPLFVDIMCASDLVDIPPPTGSYARIDDQWHRLVAVSEGRMPSLTLIDVSGETYTIAQGEFIVVLNRVTGAIKVWISSEEKPDMSDIVGAELEGFFPSTTRVLPPVISSWSRRVSFEPPHTLESPFTLAWSRMWPEQMKLEPAVVWSAPTWSADDDAVIFEESEKLDDEHWKIEVVFPDGTTRLVSTAFISLRKILSRSNYDSRVEARLLPDSGLSGYGAELRLVYPLRSPVVLDTDRFDPSLLSLPNWCDKLGRGDHRGDFSARRQTSIEFSADKTVVGIKVVSARSAGYDGSFVINSYLSAVCSGDIDNPVLIERPFEQREAYHAPDDDSWKLDGSNIWDSRRLVGVVADDGVVGDDGVELFNAPGDIPRFGHISMLWFATQDGIRSPGSEEQSVSLGLSVSTLGIEGSTTDLLLVASAQARVHGFKDSRFGREDWIDLYVLSLMRADERYVDTLETYSAWRASIVSGETPSIYPSPPIDHETRLIDRDDPYLQYICPEITSGAVRPVFGIRRTAVPFGTTVFNRDQYDGSTRPSLDPCDIDVSFVEPCDCSPASHVAWAVRLDVSRGITDHEVRLIMDEMLPAHAVTRASQFRHLFTEPARRTAESIAHLLRHKFLETTLTFNPLQKPDGSYTPSPMWDQFLSTNHPPHATLTGVFSLSDETDEQDMWALLASDAGKGLIPFGSMDIDTIASVGTTAEGAFCISTTSGARRLVGIRRYGDSTFLFRESATGGGAPAAMTSDYSIWNTICPEAEFELVIESQTTWISFDRSIIDAMGIRPGFKMIFIFAPSSGSAATGDRIIYSRDVINIHSMDQKVWVEIDEDDPAANMPLLDTMTPGGRPAAILFSRDGEMKVSSCLRFRSDTLADKAQPRGRIMQVTDLPMTDQHVTQSDIEFRIGKTILPGCLVVSEQDWTRFASLFQDLTATSYDPDGIGDIFPGDLVDAIGSIASRGGQIICDFVVKNGLIKIKMAEGIPVAVSSAVVSSSSTTTIVITFTTDFDRLMATDLTYVTGETNHTRDAYVRSTALLMPRSTGMDRDLDDRYFLFIGGHYMNTAFLPQASIKTRRVGSVSAESEAVEHSVVRVGDYLFLGPDFLDWSARITKVDKAAGKYYMMVADWPGSLPDGTYQALAARLAVQSKTKGTWKRAMREVVVDIDLLTALPTGSQDYDNIPFLVSARWNNFRLPILSASAGPDPGTTTLRMQRPVFIDEDPVAGGENIQFTVYDLEASNTVAEELRGGSKIISKVYVNSVLSETQEFN